MKNIFTMVALSAISIPAAAADDLGFYGSMGGGAYRLKADGFKDNAPSANFLAGYSFSNNLAVEGAYTKLFNATGRVEGIDVTVDGNLWDLSTKLSYPVGDRFAPFGRVGWSYADLAARTSGLGLGARANEYDDAFVWGVGTRFKATKRIDLSGEYSRVLINSGDLDRVSLNLNLRFGS